MTYQEALRELAIKQVLEKTDNLTRFSTWAEITPEFYALLYATELLAYGHWTGGPPTLAETWEVLVHVDFSVLLVCVNITAVREAL